MTAPCCWSPTTTTSSTKSPPASGTSKPARKSKTSKAPTANSSPPPKKKLHSVTTQTETENKKHGVTGAAAPCFFAVGQDFLQRIQKRLQLGFLFAGEVHLETLVVEVEELVEVLRRSVVEVRRAGREPP